MKLKLLYKGHFHAHCTIKTKYMSIMNWLKIYYIKYRNWSHTWTSTTSFEIQATIQHRFMSKYITNKMTSLKRLNSKDKKQMPLFSWIYSSTAPVVQLHKERTSWEIFWSTSALYIARLYILTSPIFFLISLHLPEKPAKLCNSLAILMFGYLQLKKVIV